MTANISPAFRAWITGVLERHGWLADDPNPEYSRLDRMDGLHD